MKQNEEQAFPYEELFQTGMPVRDQYFYLKHPKMPCGKRAKIFAPFSALKGFDEEVSAKEVQYVEKRILSEEECAEINTVLTILHVLTKTGRQAEKHAVKVRAVYYSPCQDMHHPKFGLWGTYETVTDTVRQVDPIRRVLITERYRISFEDLSEIGIIDSGLQKGEDALVQCAGESCFPEGTDRFLR